MTGGFPRLAQEYAASFGKNELHRFLKNQIMDDDLNPGDVHQRLLRLPWRDVFTTNWDTLLEKQSESVAEQKYSIVRNKDEIPLTVGPRIVKLHGSFPSYFPLICTEEDYRKYPIQFAPFVNMVQQAMMETTFFLIGFSGDDPNFLHWSGWVRDNLGELAPKIYLAGWLDLQPPQRRVLEERNIIPVDLARHPKADKWPEQDCHKFAIDWILHTLEQGRPYDVINWPSKNIWQREEIPEYLEPVEKRIFESPKEEPWASSQELANPVEILDIWSHNRCLYPGWLVVPADVRHEIMSKTDEWERHVIKYLPECSTAEKLNAIYEVVWRREILLDPILSELESAADEVLRHIDCRSNTINGVAETTIAWSDIRKKWITVALSLVTSARLSFDQELFKTRINKLLVFQSDNVEIEQRLSYEQCLWAIYDMDFETLENMLNNWSTQNCDPIWAVRKAAILFELGHIDAASELFNSAFLAIRRTPDDPGSLAGPSREGWALFLKWSLDQRKLIASGDLSSFPIEAFRQRWRELASLKCDALSERDAYVNLLKSRDKREDAPAFDLNVRIYPGIEISSSDYLRWFTALRAVRLSEVAGLPVSDSSILKLAVDELSETEPELAVRLLLRTLTNDQDKLLKRVLSRSRVAKMESKLITNLVNTCERIINYELKNSLSSSNFHLDHSHGRVRVAMEILSRLVIRLESEKVERLFNKAMQYYKNEQFASNHQFSNAIWNLLSRSWAAFTDNLRVKHVLNILNAPIVGVEGFANDNKPLIDPGELLSGGFPLPVREGNDIQWQQIISLLIKGLNSDITARERAAKRLAYSDIWKKCSDDEIDIIARALWNDVSETRDLPAETSLYDWIFLILPEPEPGLAERGFRQKWLMMRNNEEISINKAGDTLFHVGTAISELKKCTLSLDLSDTECDYLIKIIDKWSKSPIIKPDEFLIHRQHTIVWQQTDGLQSIISAIPLPKSIGEELYNKIKRLNELGYPIMHIISALVHMLPERIDEIASLLRVNLASDDDDIAGNAMIGLGGWLSKSWTSELPIQVPPDDLIREIGVIIATRRKANLEQALYIAKLLLDKGTQKQQNIICDLVLDGLNYLYKELDYNREIDIEENLNIPRLRWHSVRLSLAMSERGYRDNVIIARWLEVINDDPLHEVRNIRGDRPQ